LLSPSEFRDLVSGRRSGVRAGLLRSALRLAETPYAAAVRLRNWRFDTGRARAQRVSVPVISVGNITLGGTGKTPAVEWLARWLLERGVRVGLVSRGYGSQNGRPNDEALELADKLPDVPHVLDPDRVRGANRAIEEFGCQLILLDDGFQHRRLARDFDLVLIDALEPFGFEHVFPRGTLREPLAGWSRASALMLTRAEQLDAPQRAAIRARAMQFAPQAIWLESNYQPYALRSIGGGALPLDLLLGKSLAAFCGIGNPDGFRRALADQRYIVNAFREFADHFGYPADAMTELTRWVDDANVATVVCTHKDLVKVGPQWTSETPLLALASRLEVQIGQPELEAALAPLVQRAQTAR
jgi:tetraacyldisaccharide 4'-kinase